MGLRNPVVNLNNIVELNTGLDPRFNIQGSREKFPWNLESGIQAKIKVHDIAEVQYRVLNFNTEY